MPGLFSGCLAIPSIVPKFVWLGDVHAHAADLCRITRAADRAALARKLCELGVKSRGTPGFMKRFIISYGACVYIYILFSVPFTYMYPENYTRTDYSVFNNVSLPWISAT